MPSSSALLMAVLLPALVVTAFQPQAIPKSGARRCTCSMQDMPNRRALLFGGIAAGGGSLLLPLPSLTGAGGNSTWAAAAGLPKEAYTTLNNGLKVCKIQTGLLQLSPKTTLLGPGPEDYWTSELGESVAYMKRMVNAGFTTFDLADVYGPAEDYVGAYHDVHGVSDGAVFNTKWIPTGTGPKPKEIVKAALEKSMGRMKSPSLDLVQFYWWDYDKKNYVEMLQNAQELRKLGLAKGISVTGIDTERVSEIMAGGVELSSVQASLSVIDTRPIDGGMLALLSSTGAGTLLFAHGVLMGGFLTDAWLGRPEPPADSLGTSQLRKYGKWIKKWGDWALLQEMLSVLRRVGDRHGGAPIAAVAISWALMQPGVASVIVGLRPGSPTAVKHLAENRQGLTLRLTAVDVEEIAAVQAKGTPLLASLGDVGGEFHVKSRRKGAKKAPVGK